MRKGYPSHPCEKRKLRTSALEERVPASQSGQVHRKSDSGVNIKPILLLVRDERAHPLSYHLNESSLSLEGRIYANELIVKSPLRFIKLQINDTETSINRGNNRTVLGLLLAQFCFRLNCCRSFHYCFRIPGLVESPFTEELRWSAVSFRMLSNRAQTGT